MKQAEEARRLPVAGAEGGMAGGGVTGNRFRVLGGMKWSKIDCGDGRTAL